MCFSWEAIRWVLYRLHYLVSLVDQTTARVLCYVFLLLALFPEEQDKLYNHIKEVIGDREPVSVSIYSEQARNKIS
jgi:hypothetical protein